MNGDGFDDFLIGAPEDEDGGNRAGQTYLVLGRAAADRGMDFDLSNADASFWGEDALDYSGFSVSGAGDVNGDGFDDFLIGAWGNDDGGDEAGQTYLILGSPPPAPVPIPVGGFIVPVNKFELLAPWLGLAALVSLAALTFALVRRHRSA